MAVGATVSSAQLNNILTSLANRMQEVMADVVELWDWIATLGADATAQKAALVTLGFSAQDADTFWTKANNMFAVAQVYYGQGTQPSTFDFDSALSGVRGPG
jgi:hypothetical protein